MLRGIPTRLLKTLLPLVLIPLPATRLGAQVEACVDVETPRVSNDVPPGERKRIRVGPSSRCLERYLRVVGRFRGGESDAVAEISRWSPSVIGEVIGYLFDRPDVVSRDMVTAAVVLHADAAFRLLEDKQTVLGDFHVTFARKLIEALGDSGRKWLRELLLMMGYFYQSPAVQPDDGPSIDFFQEALKLFPEDGRILLGIGSLHEGVARLTSDPMKMKRAEAFFRRAVASDPALVEAHLRLGATLATSGSDTEALEKLQWVLANTEVPYFRYLAYLFQGDVHRRSDRLTEAVGAYRSATTTEPNWQVACLSLSHALLRSGARRQSREIMEKCVALRTEQGDDEDGWWRYLGGQSHQLDAIRKEWRLRIQ